MATLSMSTIVPTLNLLSTLGSSYSFCFRNLD